MRISCFIKISCTLIVILLAISAPASGYYFAVSDQGSFQSALTTAASNGQADTIDVAGTFNVSGSLTYYASLNENYALTIISYSAASLSGDGINRVLSVDSTGVQNNNDDNVHFTVRGIAFQNGYGDLYGGGVYMDGHKADMTIENCNFASNGASSGGAGANAYSSSGTVTLKGCNFTSNKTYEGEGGGAYLASPNGTIVVENNVFTGNYTEGYGDGVGVYIWGGTVTVTGNTFQNNTAYGEYSYGGGGAYIYGDSVTVTNNTFTGNSSGSESEGGGAYIYGSSSITMTGNDFTNNTAEYGGGGADVDCYGDITMTDNVFTGNIAGEGGGAEIDARKGLFMVNNVFAGNTANNYGGGVDLSLSSLTSPATVTNNTFTQNLALTGGGLYIAISENTDTLNFYNNIVYGNTATTGGDLYLRDDRNSDGIGSIVNLFNNNFNSLYTQDGDNLTQADNISGDPLLSGDYHLNAASPCIDVGDNSAVPTGITEDMDGDARIIDGDNIGDARVDIGADEHKYIDTDSDGVQDSEEMGPGGDDPGYDGNNDTIPDRQQNNAASMYTYNNEKYVTVASPAGTALSNVRAIVPPGTPPVGVDFEYGCFDFTVTGVEVGGSLNVTFFGPYSAVFDTYYKYGKTSDNQTSHWYEFLFDGETGAVISGNEITLHLVDGQRGDDDFTPNGTIVEPGGPAIVLAPECEGDFDSDGDVDGSDLAVFAADFGRTDCENEPPCEGDFDHDGDVDGSDLAVFAADFGRTDCPQ